LKASSESTQQSAEPFGVFEFSIRKFLSRVQSGFDSSTRFNFKSMLLNKSLLEERVFVSAERVEAAETSSGQPSVTHFPHQSIEIRSVFKPLSASIDRFECNFVS
jgi:hypothetical protein